MLTQDITQVRETISESVNRVSFGKDRMAIRRHGKIVAGIVSADDLELLERINARDLKALKEAIVSAKAKGEKPVPWADAKKQLGL